MRRYNHRTLNSHFLIRYPYLSKLGKQACRFFGVIKPLVQAGDALDAARSIIDRDIARLEVSIRALKSRRNELSPISCLPAEILCNILSLIEDNRLLVGRIPKFWSNQLGPTLVMYHNVGDHLWTNIPLNYPKWAHEFLIRSKRAKLTIRLGSDFDMLDSKTVRPCLYEMNRVEEINITTISKMMLKKNFQDLPNKSAPQLHTLCIGHSSCLHGPAFSVHENFLYDTERLQRVELINCKISWDSRLLTGLTRLTLKDSLKENSSIIQFLHALRRMPALTDLYLEDSIPDDSGGLSTYPVADLPCLRFLYISSGVGTLTTVLRHITCAVRAAALHGMSEFLKRSLRRS